MIAKKKKSFECHTIIHFTNISEESENQQKLNASNIDLSTHEHVTIRFNTTDIFGSFR